MKEYRQKNSKLAECIIWLMTLTFMLVATSLSQKSYGQTRTIYTTPKILWHISTGPDASLPFDSPADVFSRYATYIASQNNDSVVATEYNLHFAPDDNNVIYNSAKMVYWWDYTIVYPNNPSANYMGTTGLLSGSAVCPDSYSLSYIPEMGIAYKVYCKSTLSTLEPAPRSCPIGNPIYPEAGLKKQVELDYVSANQLLTMERTYRSDVGRFSSALSSAFLDYSLPSTTFNRCVTEQYRRTTDVNGLPVVDSYCFPVMSVESPEAVLLMASGREIGFDQSTGLAVSDSNINDSPKKPQTVKVI